MIIGKEIYLRPIKKNDLDLLNKWKNDKEVFKYLGGGFMPISIDQQEKWLESMIDLTGNNKRFMVCTSNHDSIGMIGLYDINWIHRTCEVGLYIGEKSYHGKGYAKQAYYLIEKYAKEYLNLRKIKLNVVNNNEKATNLWNALGFNKVGMLKEERFIEGKYMDLILMEKFIS